MVSRLFKKKSASIGIVSELYLIRVFAVIFVWICSFAVPAHGEISRATQNRFVSDIRTLSGFEDRSTGTAGFNSAAEFIEQSLADLDFGDVKTHLFLVPTLLHNNSTLTVLSSGQTITVDPIRANAISPGTIAPPGIEAPLVYAGRGELSELSGKNIEGTIVLMELDSGKNWLNAASLGAKALIYLDRGDSTKSFFEEKFEQINKLKVQNSEQGKCDCAFTLL